MRTIIAGTRTVTDFSLVENAIQQSGWATSISEVVSGAASYHVLEYLLGQRKANVDILGARWAELRGLPIAYFDARWDLYGRGAGPIRNSDMVAYADALILVWDFKSKGSADVRAKALQRGLPVFEWSSVPVVRE